VAPHQIEITPEEGRVEVRLGSTVLADSEHALVLAETGLVERFYLPREDVRMDLLEPTDSATTCPFKGQASYWSATVDGTTHADLAWSYEAPIPTAAAIEGRICFYNERVELRLDAEPVPAR
jgi:uncharacterized protein (DUF427 family)